MKSNLIAPRIYLLVALLLLVIGGCSTVSVHTALDPVVEFRNYHTFNFKQPVMGSNPVYMGKLNEERVKNAIRRELEQRGLTQSDTPDLLVNFYLSVASKTYDLEHPTAKGGSVGATMASYFGFYYRSGQSLNQQDAIAYHEGALVIDVIDVKGNRVVWQAVVAGVLYPDQTEEQAQLRIRQSVHSAFKQFPR